jgi:CRISPR type III-A-associated RAMP protein Csm5
MSAPRSIRTSFHCTVTAETPLHIGSGEILKRGFDFLSEKGNIRVISHAKLFQRLQEFGTENIIPFMKAIEDERPLVWLQDNGVSLDDIEAHSPMPWPETPNEIRAQIRDGRGNPLVPGSSLKGSLRTVVLKQLSKENSKKVVNNSINSIKRKKSVQLKTADQEICARLLGEDPKTNLMRTLSVGDFTFAPEHIGLQNVVISRLVSKTSMERMRKHGQPIQITVEKIKKEAVSRGRISFDTFLYARDEKTKKICLGFNAELDLDWLVEAIRDLTKDFIADELDFLADKNGTYINDLGKFYNDLQKKLEGLKRNEVLLHLGWGIGWRGMTGELIDNSDLSADGHQVRKKLKLAIKHLGFPFPKNRRLAVSGDYIQPMGWVRLTFLPLEKTA